MLISIAICIKETKCEKDSTEEDTIQSFECKINIISLNSKYNGFNIEDVQIRYELPICDEDDINVFPVLSTDGKYPIFDDDNWNVTCENKLLIANYSLSIFTSSLDIWCGYNGNINKTEYKYLQKQQLGCKDNYNELYLLNFNDKRECKSPPFDPTKFKTVICNENNYKAVILQECQCPIEYINGSERYEIKSDNNRYVNSGVDIEGKCTYGGTSTVTLKCTYSGWILDKSKGSCQNKSSLISYSYLLLVIYILIVI